MAETEPFKIRLRRWRGTLRQKQAAEILRVSIRTYTCWERGYNAPGILAMAELERRMKDYEQQNSQTAAPGVEGGGQKLL